MINRRSAFANRCVRSRRCFKRNSEKSQLADDSAHAQSVSELLHGLGAQPKPQNDKVRQRSPGKRQWWVPPINRTTERRRRSACLTLHHGFPAPLTPAKPASLTRQFYAARILLKKPFTLVWRSLARADSLTIHPLISPTAAALLLAASSTERICSDARAVLPAAV
jgi:hypothetical protein